MTRTVLNLSFAIILGFSISCATQTNILQMSEADLDTEIIEITGIEANFDQLYLTFKESFRKKRDQVPEMDERVFTSLENSLMEIMDPKKLKASYKKLFLSHLTILEKREIVAWYRHDLGQKILQMEQKSLTWSGQAEFQRWISYLQKEGIQLSPEELSFATKVIDSSGNLNATVDMMNSMSFAIIRGYNTTLPRRNRLSPQQIKQQIERERASLKSSLKPILVYATHFTYRSLTQEQRSEFLMFLQSSTGVKLTQTANKSIKKTMLLAAENIGPAIQRQLASIPKDED